MLFASLMLAAAATAPTAPAAAYSPQPISAEDKAEIMRQADQMMFDGPATRWEWPERRDTRLYCSKLNGKNQLGAYTGWRPFFFLMGKLRIPDGDIMMDLYRDICTKAGYLPVEP